MKGGCGGGSFDARTLGRKLSEMGIALGLEVLLGKDRSINAFAVPGGWLGLHLGLVSATASRDELASVLAHELTHVTQRHISRLSEVQSRQVPLILAGIVLGALAARRSADAAGVGYCEQRVKLPERDGFAVQAMLRRHGV